MGGVTEKDFDRRLSLVAKFGETFFKRYPHKKVKGYGEMYAEAIRLMRSDDVNAFLASGLTTGLATFTGGVTGSGFAGSPCSSLCCQQ